MKKSKKVLFIVAAALIGGGIITGIVGFGLMRGDIMVLNMSKTVSNSHEINQEFSNIAIECDTADVNLLVSDDGVCRVECKETDNLYHTVTVEDGTLRIIRTDVRKWYQHIGIFSAEMEINVYLSNDVYESVCVESDTGDITANEALSFARVSVETDTGDINVNSNVTESVEISTDTGKTNITNAHVDSLKASASTGNVSISDSETVTLTLKTSTGKVYLNGVRCRSMHVETSTGGLTAEDVIAEMDAVVRCSTGNVKLYDFDAEVIDVKTSTGDVYGELLSDKIFSTNTSTGNIYVPRSELGGRCDVTTSTGDIEFKIK